MHAPNRNLLWAKGFVEELARGGLKAVCIAPGSRSTPLAIAFAEQPGIQVYSHIDERSASFFALGLALADDAPAAVLCSSGTATANFYPAIIEAHYSNVPLLILTADRSPELRHSGANQTIDQVKLYGDHVLWAVDVALPEAEPPALAVRNLRTLAARALATANGLPKGPVHLNFPFRKPLEPIPVERDLHTIPDERPPGVPMTRLWHGRLMPDSAHITAIGDSLRQAKRGLIICGPRCPGADFPATVSRLAEVSGFMLVADPLSGVRYGSHAGEIEAGRLLSAYDNYLAIAQAWGTPDVIVSFGRTVTSQALDDYLNSAPDAQRWMVSADGVWADPNHRLDTFLWADPTAVCEQLIAYLSAIDGSNTLTDTVWRDRLLQAEEVARQVICADTGDYFDGLVVRDVLDELPNNALLFVANSLPVRHLDQFALSTSKSVRIFCNRGASGIDGTVSSALGVAAHQPELPLVLVTGDLAFYHDLNGLLAVKRCGIKAIFVVINNDGGGIFQRLPIAKFDPPFTDLFVTPHGLNFESAATMYGLHYTLARDSHTFRAAFAEALTTLNAGTAAIIEVQTDRQCDFQRRTELMTRISTALP